MKDQTEFISPRRNETLSTRWTWLLAVLGVGAFHIAYEWEAAAGVIVIYLACLYRLAWVKSARWAFYLGLGIGFSIAAPQLWFFVGVFGPAAVGLWLILGLWIAFYLLLAQVAVVRWPQRGPWLLPWLWFALEYFRSELYYLRFAWLIPGFALSHPDWVPLTSVGVYGFSLVVMLLIAAGHSILGRQFVRDRTMIAGGALIAVIAQTLSFSDIGRSPPDVRAASPFVVGIQLEGPSEAQVIESLNSALRQFPRCELLVLSEYTFDGPVPESVTAWCRTHEKHLIVGGKDVADNGTDYYDTVFVVGPSGEIVFRQGKTIPIQFMNDGLPAPSQDVWRSPWGNIGIAICYDLSYSRVIDRLVAAGAQALVIPAMDAEDWGAHEHVLHAKIVPVRAREYGIPILRLASSGISQLVAADGAVVAYAPFPGQGDQVAGTLSMTETSHFPPDQYLALPAVITVAAIFVGLAIRTKS